MLLIDPKLVNPLQGDFSAVRFHGLGNPAPENDVVIQRR